MKKIISILAVLAMSLQMTVAFAAAPSVTASNVTGKAGETVDVTLTLADCPQWNNINITTDYDADVFTLVNMSDDLGKGNAIQSETFDVVPYQTGWTSAPAKIDFNGKLATLTFEISDDAEPGVYPITVSYYNPTGSYVDGKNCNYYLTGLKATALGLTYVNGSITVEGDEPAGPTLAAAKTASGVSITATAEEFTGKFIVAAYDSEGLTAVEVLNAAATATSTVTGDTVKVMWWDSLTGLNSIVPAVTAQ